MQRRRCRQGDGCSSLPGVVNELLPRSARILLVSSLALSPLVAGAQPLPPTPSLHPPSTTQPAPTPTQPAPAQPAQTTPPPPPGAATTPPAPPPGASAQNANGPRTAVIDAAPIGVDPAAAAFVTRVLRGVVSDAGFAVIPTPELYAAAQRLQLPFPVPAEGIYLLERALQAPLALTAEVRASRGLYVVRVRVRVAVEATERVREVSANQFQLEDQLRAALPELLVPPDPSRTAAQGAQGANPPGGANPQPGTGTGATPEQPLPLPRRRRVRVHPRRWELSLGPTFAFGPGRDAFFNFLASARVGFFPQDRFGFTLTVSYANLRGSEGRVSNVLFMAGVETSVDLAPSIKLFIPLRAEGGYLPLNGPVFRVTAGLSWQFARRWRLEADLLSPTLWILPETTPVSLDLGVRIVAGL